MNVTLDSGASKRLLTGGKYCPEDIVVTVKSGANDRTRENALMARTLTEYVNDDITDIATYAFYWYEALTSVSCANAVYARSSSFYKCTALTNIDLPSLAYLSSSSFMYCSALTEATFPSVLTVDTRSIAYCPLLKKLDLGRATAISHESFRGNTAMDLLIIRRADRICKLNAVSAFTDTPFATGKGTLVVPRELLETYKSDEYWSVILGYGNKFIELEGSAYE